MIDSNNLYLRVVSFNDSETVPMQGYLIDWHSSTYDYKVWWGTRANELWFWMHVW